MCGIYRSIHLGDIFLCRFAGSADSLTKKYIFKKTLPIYSRSTDLLILKQLLCHELQIQSQEHKLKRLVVSKKGMKDKCKIRGNRTPNPVYVAH